MATLYESKCHSSIIKHFGAFDIRGIVDEGLNADAYFLLGHAYGQWLKDTLPDEPHPLTLAVGYDARLHSPELANALIEGLVNQGVHIIELGLCPTPAVYFTEFHAEDSENDLSPITGTLTVTASHNPAPYNGLKFTLHQKPLTPEQVASFKATVSTVENHSEPIFREICSPGSRTLWNPLPTYLDYLVAQAQPLQVPLTIVIDAGNATGGLVAPDLFRRLGCEVIEHCTKPDGRFPHHHPDPCRHENLTSLIAEVRAHQADFGLAFDGDSDRLGVVDCDGNILPGDILLLLYAESFLTNGPPPHVNPWIVGEVKCSQRLFQRVQDLGGRGLMAPTGHVFLKTMMEKENAALGGELSGHFFFRDRYLGFDDAHYAGIRFMELIQQRKQGNPTFRSSQLTDHLPISFLSEELRVYEDPVALPSMLARLETAVRKYLPSLNLTIQETIQVDGTRLVFEGGFFLIRASNTEPCITIRYELPNHSLVETFHSFLAHQIPGEENK